MDAALLPDLLGYKDLAGVGLTRRQFDRLIDAEEYERIAPGQFLRAGATDDTTAVWMAITAQRSQAMLCLLTALSIHDLTDEIPARTNIAIPRGTKPLTSGVHRSVGTTLMLQPSILAILSTRCPAERRLVCIPRNARTLTCSASDTYGVATSQLMRSSDGSASKGTVRPGYS